MANRLAMVMLAMVVMYIIICHCFTIGANTVVSTVKSVNTAAPFDITDRYAVTAVGAPS